MHMMRKLIRLIRAELCDSEKYIDCAFKHKEADIELANTFYNLANEEMNHAETLKAQLMKSVQMLTQKANLTTDEEEKAEARAMEYVWAYESEIITDDTLRLKTKIASYR